MYKNVPEEKGEVLHTVVTGQGLFPCGKYSCYISSVRELENGISEIILDEPAKGVHIETVHNLPDWATTGVDVEVEISLSDGVYARRNAKGELALFEQGTHKRVSPFTRNIIPHLKGKKLSSPTIKSIRSGDRVWTTSF